MQSINHNKYTKHHDTYTYAIKKKQYIIINNTIKYHIEHIKYIHCNTINIMHQIQYIQYKAKNTLEAIHTIHTVL